MISVARASRLILKQARTLGSEWVDLDKALGRVLAAPLYAKVDYPAFDNSAMDGYAVRSAELARARQSDPARLPLRGTRLARPGRVARLEPGSAQGVMTGAPIPKGADAVLPREAVALKEGALWVSDPPRRGQHLRRKGEDLKKGARVARQGQVLAPRDLALAAGVGLAKMPCRREPRVEVLVTGSELAAPGQGLRPGQIFDSNGPMLLAALRKMGLSRVRLRRISDRAAQFTAAVREALSRADVLLVSGGVSVGDKDLTKPVLRHEGVREIFWKVRQKPGKPLFFGVKGRRLIFGLPGNPAAALVCFARYVAPALRQIEGRQQLPPLQGRLAETRVNHEDKVIFLRCQMQGGKAGLPRVSVLAKQGSHSLSSLAAGQVLLPLPPRGRLAKGARVSCLLW